MKSSVLSSLIETARRPGHDKRPSIEVFADLDVNRIASELKLEETGKERGGRDEPSATSVAMDDVEARIVERIESERKAAHAIVEDNLRTFTERLAGLDFEGRFSSIRQAAPACVGEFNAEVAKGLNDLHGRRRDLRELEKEYNAFRRNNRLERTADVQGGAWHFMKWAILAVLLLLEAGLNGAFLAKGDEMGLLGGVGQAFGFALVNIGGAFMLAKGAAQLAHRSIFRKAFGLVSLAAYIALAIGLNLALAHYREVSETLVDGASKLVMSKILNSPLGLEELNSWIFFGIGLLASIVAFFDSLSLSDSYPGFTKVQKRLSERRAAYRFEVNGLIDELGDIRDRYRDDMNELNRDLSVRRGEHDVVLSSRARLIQLFDQHQTQLERAGNALLSIYREANSRERKTKAPKRFTSAFRMERVQVFGNSGAEWEPTELRKHIMAVQELLTAEVMTIHAAFDAAVLKYRGLDDLIPDEGPARGAQ